MSFEANRTIPVNTEEPRNIDIVWGADQIGKLINLSPRSAYHLLARGEIKSAKHVGHRWCASRTALLREFGGG